MPLSRRYWRKVDLQSTSDGYPSTRAPENPTTNFIGRPHLKSERFGTNNSDVSTVADSLPDLGQDARQGSGSSQSSEASPSSSYGVQAVIQTSGKAQIWRPSKYQLVKPLQSAARNQGSVDLMKHLESGSFVAVKRMPNSWTASGHEEFLRLHPYETELPWIDIAVIQYLSEKAYPYICELLGVYRSEAETFVVSAFATEGDLFSRFQLGPPVGLEREDMLRPVVIQVIRAVQLLHGLGIAHCDLSLENILLTQVQGSSGSPEFQIRLIDFGMAATTSSWLIGVRGKASYQAPEMHEPEAYDPFLADAFSLGAAIFCLAAKDYPWLSTRPGGCRCFNYVSKHGLQQYLRKRKVRAGSTTVLMEAFTADLVELLDGLLNVQPLVRLTVSSASCLSWLLGERP